MLCRWVGELYLELHQGTYTTQALVSQALASSDQVACCSSCVTCLSIMLSFYHSVFMLFVCENVCFLTYVNSCTQIKKENRQLEILLHDVELIATLVVACKTSLHLNCVTCPLPPSLSPLDNNVSCGPTVSKQWEKGIEIKQLLRPVWKKFLLNQFHDVLPGSCIEEVSLPLLATVCLGNELKVLR